CNKFNTDEKTTAVEAVLAAIGRHLDYLESVVTMNSNLLKNLEILRDPGRIREFFSSCGFKAEVTPLTDDVYSDLAYGIVVRRGADRNGPEEGILVEPGDGSEEGRPLTGPVKTSTTRAGGLQQFPEDWLDLLPKLRLEKGASWDDLRDAENAWHDSMPGQESSTVAAVSYLRTIDSDLSRLGDSLNCLRTLYAMDTAFKLGRMNYLDVADIDINGILETIAAKKDGAKLFDFWFDYMRQLAVMDRSYMGVERWIHDKMRPETKHLFNVMPPFCRTSECKFYMAIQDRAIVWVEQGEDYMWKESPQPTQYICKALKDTTTGKDYGLRIVMDTETGILHRASTVGRPTTLIPFINRHYEGGWQKFLEDHVPGPATSTSQDGTSVAGKGKPNVTANITETDEELRRYFAEEVLEKIGYGGQIVAYVTSDKRLVLKDLKSPHLNKYELLRCLELAQKQIPRMVPAFRVLEGETSYRTREDRGGEITTEFAYVQRYVPKSLCERVLELYKNEDITGMNLLRSRLINRFRYMKGAGIVFSDCLLLEAFRVDEDDEIFLVDMDAVQPPSPLFNRNALTLSLKAENVFDPVKYPSPDDKRSIKKAYRAFAGENLMGDILGVESDGPKGDTPEGGQPHAATSASQEPPDERGDVHASDAGNARMEELKDLTFEEYIQHESVRGANLIESYLYLKGSICRSFHDDLPSCAGQIALDAVSVKGDGPDRDTLDTGTSTATAATHDAQDTISQYQAQESLRLDAKLLLELEEHGLTEEYIKEGMIYKIRANSDWADKHESQYQMLKLWVQALRDRYPTSTFELIANGDPSNGLIHIESMRSPVYDKVLGIMPKRNTHIGSSSVSVSVAQSYKVEDLDIGYRIPKTFLLAFAASNIPDNIDSWNGNVKELAEFVSALYARLTGKEELFKDIDLDNLTSDDIDEIIKRKSHIKMDLPPINRLDFDSKDELEMAKEALRAA
ncbi:MAG: hypothetical protein ABH875_05225, partial [Candidatus Omnitrophota bacterium]